MSEKKSLRDAYLLALLSFVGISGIHRFYLGRPVTGFLYLISGGFVGFGTLYDLIFMRKLVDNENRRLYIQKQMDEDSDWQYDQISMPRQTIRPEAQSLEHLMFILARNNQGILTAAQLALESGISADQSEKELEKMIENGRAVEGRRKNGLMVYVFQDFLTPGMKNDIIL